MKLLKALEPLLIEIKNQCPDLYELAKDSFTSELSLTVGELKELIEQIRKIKGGNALINRNGLEPPVGTISNCVMCGKEIRFVGKYWQHTNSSPRHIARPSAKLEQHPIKIDKNHPITIEGSGVFVQIVEDEQGLFIKSTLEGWRATAINYQGGFLIKRMEPNSNDPPF